MRVHVDKSNKMYCLSTFFKRLYFVKSLTMQAYMEMNTWKIGVCTS